MSKMKGMRCYAIVEPNDDGSFFIKKSIRDGSLAIFDERHHADDELRGHPEEGCLEMEPIYIMRESRFIECASLIEPPKGDE